MKEILELMGTIWVEEMQIALSTYPNLDDSNIKKNITYVVSQNQITLIMPSYGIYIDRGRRKLVKKVPISALRDWAKRKGIPSDNSTLFAIQMHIYKFGIRARPFIERASESAEVRITMKLNDSYVKLYEESINNLIKRFN